ncbi:MAG: hypothetical protein ABIQ09_07495 [Jatrophihabitantaceae bacterium]
MRKLWAAALALVSALAFLVIGSTPANAFGSEVLGCSINYPWTANSCHSNAALADGKPVYANFSAQNLSGTYATSWTITTGTGAAVTQSCTPYNSLCIESGCTASSLACQIRWSVGYQDRTLTAVLRLTQSGQTRTVTAKATIYEGTGCNLC